MKKSLFVTACLVSSLLLKAQDPYKHGSFVIQGKVKGYTAPLFRFELTSFFDNVIHSMTVRPDGTFRQSFPVQQRQNLILSLNDEVATYAVYAGDTLHLSWDDNNFSNTFRIEGKNKQRTRDLSVERNVYTQVRRPLTHLLDSLETANKTPEPEAYCQLLNSFYNREIKFILNAAAGVVTPHTDHLMTDVYFDYARWMMAIDRQSWVTPRPVLQLDKAKTYPIFSIADSVNHSAVYSRMNESWWQNLPRYRDFLYDYVRFYDPRRSGPTGAASDMQATAAIQQDDGFSKAVAAVLAQGKNPELFALQGVDQGNKYIPVPAIREWYNTKVVMDGFGLYSFEDTEMAYQSIISKLESAYLRDTLQRFYRSMLRLKPGSPAPLFSLLNEKGKSVSLTDFRGKVVYIDFWGVGCGPCIYEIKNHVPELQKRYEGKDVVFLNICVDVNGKKWMAALRKYKPGGINLNAKGATSHPVCQDYNVNALPHHVLIDKAGNIVDNNAPRASELLRPGRDNAIDVLLK